jgi:hypothetical protein
MLGAKTSKGKDRPHVEMPPRSAGRSNKRANENVDFEPCLPHPFRNTLEKGILALALDKEMEKKNVFA